MVKHLIYTLHKQTGLDLRGVGRAADPDSGKERVEVARALQVRSQWVNGCRSGGEKVGGGERGREGLGDLPHQAWMIGFCWLAEALGSICLPPTRHWKGAVLLQPPTLDVLTPLAPPGGALPSRRQSRRERGRVAGQMPRLLLGFLLLAQQVPGGEGGLS